MMRAMVDMDGVLADFFSGVWRLFRCETPAWPYQCRLGEWNFHNGKPLYLTDGDLAPRMGHDFYANLDLLPDARELLARIERRFGKENVFFLSSPWDTPGCDSGKREWVKKHFPDYVRRTLIGSCKEACANPWTVLFDDSETNCKKFWARQGDNPGGHAELVPRPWNRRYKECSLENGAAFLNEVGWIRSPADIVVNGNKIT